MTQLLRKERLPATGSLNAVTENTVDARILELRREHWPLVVLAVVVVAAAVAVAILAVQRETKTAQPPPAAGGPTLVSEGQLRRLAAAAPGPVYWAGPKKGFSYELTRTASGRTYVRYLPAGVRAGDPRPSFLVVGTYTQPGSFADLQRAGKQPGALSLRIDKGGLVVFSSSRPTSAYLSYPGSDYQVEVYSPSGNIARRLVLADKIQPAR